MFQSLRLEEKKKPSKQVVVQTVNLTALHPLTPGEDGSGSKKVEKVQWKESALEVLKLDFLLFFWRNKGNGTKETAGGGCMEKGGAQAYLLE